MRILLAHKLFHHRKHIHLAFVDPHLGIIEIRHPSHNVTEVHMVDLITLAKIPTHFDRIMPQLSGHTTVESYSVVRTRHDICVSLPTLDSAHDLA